MTVRTYEGLFLVEPNRASTQWEETLAHVEGLLQKHGAQVEKLIRWEDRKLAYDIGGHRRGTYILGYFQQAPGSVAALRRDLQISEVILRHIILAHTGPMLESPQDLYSDGAQEQEGAGAPAAKAEEGAPPARPAARGESPEKEKAQAAAPEEPTPDRKSEAPSTPPAEPAPEKTTEAPASPPEDGDQEKKGEG